MQHNYFTLRIEFVSLSYNKKGCKLSFLLCNSCLYTRSSRTSSTNSRPVIGFSLQRSVLQNIIYIVMLRKAQQKTGKWVQWSSSVFAKREQPGSKYKMVLTPPRPELQRWRARGPQTHWRWTLITTHTCWGSGVSTVTHTHNSCEKYPSQTYTWQPTLWNTFSQVKFVLGS